MIIIIKFLAILLSLVSVGASLRYDIDDSPLISLPYGEIKGSVLQTANSNTYYAFQDIPYAEQPVGELRFKEPLPPKNWTGILDTTKNRYICHQSHRFDQSESSDLTETEACLYLNVYMPVEPENTPTTTLPVLVWMHGGTFVSGDGTFQSAGPQFFIDYNIIVVSINYRLGPLGFLTTQDGVIPGNLGIKDQNMALQWVKNNIQFFGGDSEKITIAGESAGGGSVGLHLVSKKSKGLFRGVILQSATATCPLIRQPYARFYAFELGRAINPNLTQEDSRELLSLLQNAEVSDIVNNKITIPSDKESGTAEPWGPVIEPDVEGAYITGPMQEDIKNGKINLVPIMIGFNSKEALMDLMMDDGDGASLKVMGKTIDENLNKVFDNILNMTDENKYIAGEKIRKIYTDGQFQDDIAAFIDSTVMRFFMMHYVLGVDGGGVAHAEELNYMWSTSRNSDISQFPEQDIITHNRVLTLWTNFVKYLNPTPEEDALLENVIWQKVSPTNLTYLNINVTLEVKTNPKQYKKWQEVIDTYAIPPLAVY